MKGETAILMQVLADAGSSMSYAQCRDVWCQRTAQSHSHFGSKIWCAKKSGRVSQVGHGVGSTLRVLSDAPPVSKPCVVVPVIDRAPMEHERVRSALITKAQHSAWSTRCKSRRVRELVKAAEVAMCEPFPSVSLDYEVEG